MRGSEYQIPDAVAGVDLNQIREDLGSDAERSGTNQVNKAMLSEGYLLDTRAMLKQQQRTSERRQVKFPHEICGPRLNG